MKIDMKITMLDVSKIKPAPFEPPARLTKNALITLKQQIERVGQILQPLILDEKRNLIDGHRRLACARILGMKDVPVRFLYGTDQEIRDAFVVLNEPVRKLTSAEATHVYIKGGSVSDKELKPIVSLERLIGRVELERAVNISNGRFSAKSVMIMLSVLKKYLNIGTDDFLAKAAKWLIFQNQSFYVRTAVYTQMSRGLIVSAIETNTSLY